MADAENKETEFQDLPAGQSDPRLNGMTPEQFRALVVAAEGYLTMMLQGNVGMMATMLVELQTRMILDMDEVGNGDAMLHSFHTGLDRTVVQWRVWAAEAVEAKRNAMN